MNIPSDAADVIVKLKDKFRVDLSDWNQVYELTKKIANQMAFLEPHRRWLYLTHPEGRSDKIGYLENGTVHAWDYVISAGSSAAQLNLTGIYEPFPFGRYPTDWGIATDYLSDIPTPSPAPSPTDERELLSAILDELKSIRRKLSDGWKVS